VDALQRFDKTSIIPNPIFHVFDEFVLQVLKIHDPKIVHHALLSTFIVCIFLGNNYPISKQQSLLDCYAIVDHSLITYLLGECW